MTYSITATRKPSATILIHLLGIILLSLSAPIARGQSDADGSTPLALTPGSPAGSYALSGFDNVNLFNGNLNFHLPLLGVGGRGGADYQMTLAIDQTWTVLKEKNEIKGGTNYHPSADWWDGIKPGYGPGVMHARRGGFGSVLCTQPLGGYYYKYSQTLTRLTFTAADGTEFELRDQLTDGQPKNPIDCHNGFNRGTIFVTADGSAATFISDANIVDPVIVSPDSSVGFATGYLLLRDGTRYRFDAGQVTWIRDRNGNKLSFTYDANKRLTIITDSVNRQVTIDYDVNDGAPYGVCDRITYKGFGGAARYIRISKAKMDSALRSDFTIQTEGQLFPELPGGGGMYTYNPTVVSSVWLPNGKRYQFLYNSYGELARVVLPTGGAVEYDYLGGQVGGNDSGVMGPHIYRRLIERRVYANGTTLESKMTYSRPDVYGSGSVGYVATDELNAAGALMGRQYHYFYGAATSSFFGSGIDYSSWIHGREYKTEDYDTDGTTVIRRVERTWQQPVAGSKWPLTTAETSDSAKPNDPQITQTVTTLSDANKVAKQTFNYDEHNNRTDVYEYNYGNGAAGPLVRRTHTDYVTANVVGGVTYNYDTDTAIHIRSLPEQTSVYNSAGVEQSRTTFEYDNYTATANHAGLVARTGISGLDSAFTTAKKTRGNATAVTRYLLTNGTVTDSISTYQLYDVAGNTVKALDGRGYQMTFNFADRFGTPDAEARLNSGATELGAQVTYAFPSQVTNALGQTSYTQRDYYTGQVIDAEDSNGVTSSAYYDDELDRTTQLILAADDATLRRQAAFSYDDVNRIVTTTSDLSAYGDNLLKSQSVYDGLGRTTETRQYETPTIYVTTRQTYDALDRPSQRSNPYRAGQTVVWTTTTYDALGRVTSVKTPDGAIISSDYSGNTVTVTDQAGKDRQSTTDALGRLTQVIEDPGGLAYVTSYMYDALGNLTKVNQGAQTRSFVYDSLSRLKTATNPESGTVTYSYDDNGNLTQKKDARSITTTITYDALNRPTLKNYSDATPDVAYFYDSQTLPAGAPSFVRGPSVGRLVAVTTGGTSEGSYYGYDALGRTLRRIQQLDSINYLAEATYNKAGAKVTETYPAVPSATGRRTVSYSFNGAGRLSSLASDPTTYAAGASVSNISYAAHGALSSETLGNNLVHGLTYNTRLQPAQIKLGTAASPTSVLNLTYSYGTTSNNGDVLSVTNKVGTWTTKQTYTYDSLNRLDTTTETNGSTTTYWTEDDAYDRYGNRWEVIGGVPSLSFNAANNRINSAGYAYDANGNLTDDTSHTYDFNAENLIKSVDGAVDTYRYDGEGHRVRKYFPLGEKLRLVYGVSGQLIMEFDVTSGALQKEYIYGASGLLATIEPTKGTSYMTADHLGSLRVVTGDTGAVISRHDYKPFGQELSVGTGGRTAAQFYGADDGLRQKFTGQERDDETGLDYFQARYYSSFQGRFTSPDSVAGSKHNPQSMNLYAYVLNNPMKFLDPTGHLPANPELTNQQPQQDPPPPDRTRIVGRIEHWVVVPTSATVIVGAGPVALPGATTRVMVRAEPTGDAIDDVLTNYYRFEVKQRAQTSNLEEADSEVGGYDEKTVSEGGEVEAGTDGAKVGSGESNSETIKGNRKENVERMANTLETRDSFFDKLREMKLPSGEKLGPTRASDFMHKLEQDAQDYVDWRQSKRSQ